MRSAGDTGDLRAVRPGAADCVRDPPAGDRDPGVRVVPGAVGDAPVKAQETRTEAELLRQVTQLARQLGWIVYHTHRSQFSAAGFPDVHAIHVGQRRIVYAELKRTPKDRLGPDQEVYRAALLAVGAEWHRWDWSTPIEDIVRILRAR